ncbi:o-succinylbenzoate synthase [Halobacillus sp. Marseille-Q1614]|uniref:o-succinylbenzoate synthase n=1 Tax=Halobacillus sp. Marseille-Q1614 TaxID=2709134 RepID=UPI00156F5830|nr:o-succinylbenzoate synthase [Halobacillus sp. Marseille-Q1614]
MNIKEVRLIQVEMPLKKPFVTHQGTLEKRPVIVVEAKDHIGLSGWGEVTAFPSPFYTSETIQTARHVLSNFLIPAVKGLKKPEQFHKAVSFVKGHPMAKAGLEGALWDLAAKQQNVSLSCLVGGVKEEVEAGAVISLSSYTAEEIDSLLDEGYTRFKLKVEKGKEREMILSVRETHPDLPLMIDANGMYEEENLEEVVKLDDLGLLMIEQPFPSGDFYLHQQAQKQMKTPLCLDESIQSYEDAKQAIALGSCRIMNIKISRIGGLSAAIHVHDLCQSHNIPVWCGGMVETGISKAHNLALASLPNFQYPGDLSGSLRYFEKDIINPYFEVNNGMMQVPHGKGIGVSINKEVLRSFTKQEDRFTL